MFKKFDEKENVSNCIQLKTSVIKGIKNQLMEQFPGIEPWLNQIMPKKDPVKIVRCHEHIEILTVNGELLFFRQREGPFYPTLRLLHKYPFILPRQQVDKGAIKFVLSGANIMCPGLTSPGGPPLPRRSGHGGGDHGGGKAARSVRGRHEDVRGRDRESQQRNRHREHPLPQ
uniref:Pre-PUA domain-containing protein n=1 Tax=Bos mutus grunniens TaxID=30521 RepID=A0A8B9XAT7_BOSMU